MGFEIGLHVRTRGREECRNFSRRSLAEDYTSQLDRFATRFPSIKRVQTMRTHCIVWSDYASQPQVEIDHGIRLDTNYYFWPDSWVQDRPGLFTGSGMPMRFASEDGAMIDVYQAATQMTDESGQSYPKTIDALLDRALGPEGYYGAFVANMHTDTATHASAQSIVASARARGVPIISASQLLDWLDGRNAAAHADLSWDGAILSFSIKAPLPANGLRTLLPAQFNSKKLHTVTHAGKNLPFAPWTVKGTNYVIFDSPPGRYQGIYM
jgi:hypothetical protein